MSVRSLFLAVLFGTVGALVASDAAAPSPGSNVASASNGEAATGGSHAPVVGAPPAPSNESSAERTPPRAGRSNVSLAVDLAKEEKWITLLSNLDLFELYRSASNVVREDLLRANTGLFTEIRKDPEWFGKDLPRRTRFLNLYADHFLLKVESSTSRYLAFEAWQEILDLERAEVGKLAAKGVFLGERTAVGDRDAFERALQMDRYRWLNDENPDAFLRNQAAFRPFHTNFWRPGAELDLNQGLYAVLTGDLSNASRILEPLAAREGGFYNDRLLAAEVLAETNSVVQYRRLKEYFREMRGRPFARLADEDRYFNLATEGLLPRDVTGKSLPGILDALPEEPKTLASALALYDKAVAKGGVTGAKARYNQGMIFLKMERLPAARLAFADAQRGWPGFTPLYALGLTELRLGNAERAILTLLEARAYQDGHAGLYNHLAHASLASTNQLWRRNAEIWANRSLEIDPAHWRHRITRAEVAKAKGDGTGWTNQLRRVLTEVKDSPPETWQTHRRILGLAATNEVPRLLLETRREIEALLGGGAKVSAPE